MVEQSPANNRAQIQQELLAKADQLWAAYNTFNVVVEDAAKNYEARQTVSEEGLTCTMIKYRVNGLTLEQWEQWTRDPTLVMTQLNSKMSREVLPDDEGHKVYLLKMKMPMMISNRSTLTCYYETEKEDGTKIIMSSSRGNETIATANASKIGKDVVANNVISYTSWKPYDGGIELQQLVENDPCGSIPGFMKSKSATRAANNLIHLVNYLQTGAKPEALF